MEIDSYLGSARTPTAAKAFEYGEVFGGHLVFVSGVVGLYAGGYISETIRLLNESIPVIGEADAMLILASLPLAVDGFVLGSVDAAANIETAQWVLKVISSRHRRAMNSIWMKVRKPNDHVMHVRCDDIGEAFYRFCRIARSLEDSGNHDPSDVRDACFPGILLNTRSFDRTLSAPEILYYAFFDDIAQRDMLPDVSRDGLESWLSYGPQVRFKAHTARQETRVANLTDRFYDWKMFHAEFSELDEMGA